MRALGAVVVMLASLVGVGAACAADLWRESGRDYPLYYAAPGHRAGMRIVYDNEPGVYVRSYWRAPWGNRHYFPRAGKKPRIGRHENLAARGSYKPAKSFYRSWSASSVFMPDFVPVGPGFEPELRLK